MAADVTIIGAGPAGLTAGIFAARRELKTIVFGDPGSLSQAEEAPIVDDWPGTPNISGMDLVKNMREHAKETGVEIRDEKVISIEKSKSGFVVKNSGNKKYESRTVIIATGAKHRKAMVQGEEKFSGKGVSYCASCDGPLFKGKKVLVVGGSDSAVVSALLLEQIGVDTTLMHRRNELRAAESLQKQLLKSKVKIIWDTVLLEIKGDSMVKSAVLHNIKTNKREEVRVDGIFISMGTVPTSELAKSLGIRLNETGFIVVDKKQATNVPGVWAAGDCCNNPSKKIATAVGDGAIAAESAYFWIKEKQ